MWRSGSGFTRNKMFLQPADVCFLQSDGGNAEEAPKPQKKNSSGTSEYDFASPPRTRNIRGPSPGTPSPRTTADRRRSLDRTAWLAAGGDLKEDPREKERQRWRQFREQKTSNRSAVLQLRQKKPKHAPTEPSEWTWTHLSYPGGRLKADSPGSKNYFSMFER